MSSVEPTAPIGPEVPYAPPIIPNYVVTTGTGTISRATQSTLDAVATDSYETQLNVAAIDEPVRVIFGRRPVGAAIARPLMLGSDLLIPLLWGRGEVDAIESITMGGVALPAGASVTHYTGTQSQTVNANMVTAFAAIGITWTHTLAGFTYSVVRLPTVDSSGNPINIGDFIAICRGLKCYDPRDGAQSYATPSTWTYTTNPALCAARMLYDDTLGLGMTPTSAFWNDVTAVANANDVALSGGEKTRELNLVMEAQQPAEQWIKTFGTYAGCFITGEGSAYRLIPDKAGSSVASFTADNMVEGSFSWSKRESRKRPNLVFVRYTESNGWIPTIAPRGADIPALPSGEKRRGIIVDLPGYIKYSTALRASIETRNHLYLEDLEMAFTVFDEGISLQMGDVITVTYGALFTSKLMRIMSIQLASLGRWRIECVEYDPASYSTLVQTAPTYVDTGLPLPTAPPSVSSVTLTEEPVSVATGALPMSKIRVTWPGVTWPFFAGYKVIIKNAAGVTVDEGTTASTSYLSAAVGAFSTYTVTVQVYSNAAIGAAVTGTITLVSLGIDSLATVWSQAITAATAGWTHVNTETYKLWPGDTALRIRTAAALEHVETAVYTGSNQSTPGAATQTLDDNIATGINYVTSPVFDVGVSRAAVFALYNIVKWTNLYAANMDAIWTSSNSPTMTPVISTDYGFKSSLVGRYVQFVISTRITYVGVTAFRHLWAIEFDPGGIAALMPTVTDTFPATSSASGGVTITLPRKYITVTSVQITAEAITQANPSYSNLTLSEVSDNTLVLHCYDTTNARIAVPCSIAITGVVA